MGPGVPFAGRRDDVVIAPCRLCGHVRQLSPVIRVCWLRGCVEKNAVLYGIAEDMIRVSSALRRWWTGTLAAGMPLPPEAT